MVDQSTEDKTAPAANGKFHISIYDVFAVFCKETWIGNTVAPGHTKFKMKEFDQSLSMRSARRRLDLRADCWAELQFAGRASKFTFKGRVGNHKAPLQTYPGADLMLFEVLNASESAGSGGKDGWLDNILKHTDEGWLLFDVSFVPCAAPKRQPSTNERVSVAALREFLKAKSDREKTEAVRKALAQEHFGSSISRGLWKSAWNDPEVPKRRRGETEKTLKSRAGQ